MKNKIFITGAAGFIGSHLSEMCVRKGYQVTAFDIYNSDNKIGWLENSKYKKDMKIVLGNIRDYDSVYKAMKGSNIVFHLAALIGIPYSYNSPLAYIKTNVDGAYNVLESAKNLNIDQIIMTSTSEVYGTAKYVPIDEKHPLVGQSPYSASKIASDQLSISYYKSFKQPVKIIRPFNTYGPRQSLRAIIPTIISQCLLKNKSNIKLGNLNPTRDFVYISDICESFFHVMRSRKLFGEATNIGTKREISINNLTKLILKKMNVKRSILTNDSRIRPKTSEVERLLCNNSKIINNTRWKPSVKLDEGLDKTIRWFEENRIFNNNDYVI